MATLDIIVCCLLGIGAFTGYKQGFFISILSIVAFIFALVVAFQLMGWGATVLAQRVENLSFMLPFVAFILIFLGVILLIRGLGFLIKKTIDLTLLGSFDSIAGAVLGLIKSAFIISLFIWVTVSFEFGFLLEWQENSALYAYIEPLAPVFIRWIDQYVPFIQETITLIQELVKSATDGIIN
ncbi:CvpA family protein [Mongoliitalea daihaiensis]|uniref:CvpA family protein n=1 Tax=Mongoliitalea daihaiensis TaxID=2782006 RepID=UPI001F3D0ADB|nr:CvpA family protein [Mongoliitalea daihaiensis]UJP66297.1 CvpA family protein [Mongoliitalea daihaiensis]